MTASIFYGIVEEVNLFLKYTQRGFTLIELLIVIAVIAVIAAVVLVAIDPFEQLARGRDSGRKTQVGQISRALVTYYTLTNSFPGGAAAWLDSLRSVGELKKTPASISYFSTPSPICKGGHYLQNNLCYAANTAAPANATFVLVYAQLESKLEKKKCTGLTGPDERPFFIWVSGHYTTTGTTENASGVICRDPNGVVINWPLNPGDCNPSLPSGNYCFIP